MEGVDIDLEMEIVKKLDAKCIMKCGRKANLEVDGKFFCWECYYGRKK